MSEARRQIFIEAPPAVVWGLIADVERHPEWWPDVVEVECDEVGQGCVYREVIKVPLGTAERQFRIDELDDPTRFRIRCVSTGAFVSLALTRAQDGTFVEASAGMEPIGAGLKVFDALAGRRYFGRWLEKSLDAMRDVASARATEPAA